MKNSNIEIGALNFNGGGQLGHGSLNSDLALFENVRAITGLARSGASP